MRQNFHLHSGNRLEILAADFRDNIYRRRRNDLFAPEYVILQTRGMGIFLEQQIAEDCIAANLKMPFLNSFIDESLPAFLSPAEEAAFRSDSKYFNRDSLAWQIDRILRQNPNSYPELTRHQGNESKAVFLRKQHALAVKIGEMYDKCQYHRPQTLLDFFNDRTINLWQARLYRELSSSGHRGREYHFEKAIRAGKLKRPELLPERISLFGFNSMPPYTLNYFIKLSEFIEVHLFHLAPSNQYWCDLRSSKERIKSGEQFDENIGNILLADFGMQGRDFLCTLLEKLDFSGDDETDDFAAPLEFGDSTLHQVQNDIYNVSTPEKFSPGKSPLPDNSIQIHNCHSTQREVEVLHDQILRAIDTMKLDYRDIIITAPDINQYAPALKAVFSRGPLADALLISDRTLEGSGIVTEALLEILSLPVKRCGAKEIVDMLSLPALQHKHNISDQDLENIRKLIADGKICWGADEADRQSRCGVEYRDFSWSDGIQRLWLGFAFGNFAEKYRGDYPATSNVSATILAKLAAVVNKLLEIRKKLSSEMTVAEIKPIYEDIFSSLLPDGDDYSDELQILKSAVADIFSTAEKAGVDYSMPPEIFFDELRRRSTAGIDRQMFLRGKINCCSLVPMRSIPAKFVAVLGLNENTFPRRENFASFDLTKNRMRGDRSKIFEDRYLFLESLISAREKILFFYRGQDDANNILPPAIPLAELADYLATFYGVKEIRHKFHNFSPVYFSGSDKNFFSYDEKAAIAAREIAAGCDEQEAEKILLPQYSETPCPVPESFDLEDLIKIFDNPCRNYLHNHSDLSGWENHVDISENEPRELEPNSKREILQFFRESDDCDQLFEKLRGKRALVPGEYGKESFDNFVSLLAKLPENAKRIIRRSRDREFSFACAEGKIRGMIPCDDEGNNYFVSIDNGKKNYIRLHLQELLIAASGDFKAPSATLFSTPKAETISITSIDRQVAAERLAELLKIAKNSFNHAMPFFRRSAFEYAIRCGKENALNYARTTFAQENPNVTPECLDPAIKCFFPPEVLDDAGQVKEFKRLAEIIYAPFCAEAPAEQKKDEAQS